MTEQRYIRLAGSTRWTPTTIVLDADGCSTEVGNPFTRPLRRRENTLEMCDGVSVWHGVVLHEANPGEAAQVKWQNAIPYDPKLHGLLEDDG